MRGRSVPRNVRDVGKWRRNYRNQCSKFSIRKKKSSACTEKGKRKDDEVWLTYNVLVPPKVLMLLCPGDTVVHPKLLKVTALYSPHGAAALVELISCIYFKTLLGLFSWGHLWAHVSSKISYLCISTFYITSSLTPEIVCWCKMTPCPPAKAANQKWREIGFPYSSL